MDEIKRTQNCRGKTSGKWKNQLRNNRYRDFTRKERKRKSKVEKGVKKSKMKRRKSEKPMES